MNKTICDISHHNTITDWGKLSKAVDGLVIRGGHGPTGVDRNAETNIGRATHYDIPFGLYLYSDAKDNNEALQEMERMYEWAITFPQTRFLAFDMEVDRGSNTQSIVETVLDGLYYRKPGLPLLLYTSQNFYQTKLAAIDEKIRAKADLWIARYNSVPPTVFCTMWQYSSSGNVEGISGNVDMNMISTAAYFDLFDNYKAPTSGDTEESIEAAKKQIYEKCCQTIYDIIYED